MRRYSLALVVLVCSLFAATTCVAQFQRQKQASTYNRVEQSAKSFAPSSVSCPEKNGRFPIPSQCDAYIECIDGEGEEKLCPDGLLFNPDARFNYPCGYPIDIQCEGRSQLQPAQPTEDCPHRYGYFKVGDSSHCGQFKNCADGVGYVFNCPEGLAFNPETYRCDWPDQVPDCDAEAFLGFKCPPVDKDNFYFGELTRFFKSPSDCEHYFVCVEGRPRLMNCGEGNAFNELINACDAAENVTGCEPPFRPEDPTGPSAAFSGRSPRLF
ncbi:protein obstructor-E [Venturia canescens]|uniref:protein obstructor-E n=1 Tax=Venturia canescens TaxID=32260 RepID=UPI001C9BEDC9|nr:protein obstructor-E-like [Venturia canescens]